MGARGPLPKPDSERQRSTPPTFEPVELGTRPVSSAPKLSTHARRKLHRETRAWWDTVAGSPQASQYGPTDWQRLRMVVLPLVERFNRGVDPPRGAEPASDSELRLMAKTLSDLEADFGLDPASRQRLRWTFRPTPPSTGDPEKTAPRARKARHDPRLKLVGNDRAGG